MTRGLVCDIDKIAAIPAATVTGMKAKAEVALSFGWKKEEVATAGCADVVNFADSILRDLHELGG